MITRLNRIRLGFDVAPKSSGPGRYLTAIVDSIDPEEFEVVVFGSPVLPDDKPHVRYLTPRTETVRAIPALTAHGGPNVERSGQADRGRRWRVPVPRMLPLWAGFHRNAHRMSRRIRTEHIDIFHAQNTGCEESPVAARRARGPCVLGTFHVDGTYKLVPEHSSLRYRALEFYSSRCLHRAIAVSEATRQFWIARTGIREDRVVTIHNGVNPEKIRRRMSQRKARLRLGLPEQGRTILGSVGRLDIAKGFTELIDAVAVLRDQHPEVLLVIAGAGPLESQLTRQVEANGLKNSVRLLGYCDDVGLVYDALDVFVLSSRCDAMPFALLEAMAHALPAIGTTVGGVPEIITAEATGFLTPPRDSAALAAAILPMLSSHELRQRLGEAGRERIIRHFNEADMVRRTLDVYRDLHTVQNS